MTIRKFLLQLSFIFALIIGFTACEKDPIIDPTNNVEVATEAQLKSQTDCAELLAELLEMYSEEELAELGIDPETFCDEVEWEGEDDEWNDIDWEMECDSIVAIYAAELEAFGFDPETFCEDIFDGVVVIEIDFEDVTIENCDSIVAVYADQLEALGIDLETFCDEWNGEWDDNDEWNDIDWTADCNSLVVMYADQLEALGIDLETFCDEWGGNDDNDWDEWNNIDWEVDCDSLVVIYADQLEEWGIDPDTFCDEWGGWNDDNGDWDEWGDIDWSMNCDSLILIYADQLEEWGIDSATFCDVWNGGWNGEWDYENTVCCVLRTACGIYIHNIEIEIVAENGQITVYNLDGDVVDSIECEDTTAEVDCH